MNIGRLATNNGPNSQYFEKCSSLKIWIDHRNFKTSKMETSEQTEFVILFFYSESTVDIAIGIFDVQSCFQSYNCKTSSLLLL